ncbi:hypothetical protein J4407_02735 [Candidatus Pacearchaeota archaeon]|nr:hypothetical protein [Candidatus Pacearchaeota archaeon]
MGLEDDFMTWEEARLLDVAMGIKRETKWIFRYLRADREEIDLGPYNTKQEAKITRDNYSSHGVKCTEPIEVPKDYELRN